MGDNPYFQKLIDDFVLADRRLGDRQDIAVRFEKSHDAFSDGFSDAFSKGGDLELSYSRRLSQSEAHQLSLLGMLLRYADPNRNQKQLLLAVGTELGRIRNALGTRKAFADEVGISAAGLHAWELGYRKPNEKNLYRWCRALGILCPPRTALVQVVGLAPELVRVLKEDPEELRRLRPDQFESFVANRLDRMGYNVMLTGPTNRKDGGIDIIATKALAVGSHVLAVQVKHHMGDQKTGVEAVQRLAYWKRPPFTAGLLVTNTAFTADAVRAAAYANHGNFFSLRDFNDLKLWLQDQYGSPEDWREIPDHIELAPGIFVPVPKPRLAMPGGGLRQSGNDLKLGD